MAGNTANPRERLCLVLYAAMLAMAMALIWGHRFPPMQDYPIWLSEGEVFRRCLSGSAGDNFSIVPYPVPNTASTAVIGLLALAMPIESAGKVFLSLAMAIYAAGAYRITTPSPGQQRGILSLTPLAWMLGFPFFHGNINYYLAVGLLLVGGGYLIRRAESLSSARLGPLLALSLALFFSHALVLAAWVALLAAYLADRRRRGQWKTAAWSLAPVAVLWVGYLAGRVVRPMVPLYGPAEPVASVTLWVKNKITELLYYLCPFGQFHLSSPGAWPVALAAANAVALAGLAVLAVAVAWRTSRDKHDRWLLAGCGVYLLGWMVAPLYLGGVSSPGQRLVLPALLGGLSLAARLRWGAKARIVAGAWVGALLIFTAVYWLVYVGGVSEKMADCHARLRDLSLPGDCVHVDEGLFRFKGPLPSCRRQSIWQKALLGDHSVLGRLGYYLILERGGDGAVFGTSILRARRYPLVPRTLEELRNAAPSCLVLVGCDDGNVLLAEALSVDYRLTQRQANIMVMEKMSGDRQTAP